MRYDPFVKGVAFKIALPLGGEITNNFYFLLYTVLMFSNILKLTCNSCELRVNDI